MAPDGLGKADWKWDHELEVHIPSCTVIRYYKVLPPNRCGNGPLTGDAIASGDCGEHGSPVA